MSPADYLGNFAGSSLYHANSAINFRFLRAPPGVWSLCARARPSRNSRNAPGAVSPRSVSTGFHPPSEREQAASEMRSARVNRCARARVSLLSHYLEGHLRAERPRASRRPHRRRPRSRGIRDRSIDRSIGRPAYLGSRPAGSNLPTAPNTRGCAFTTRRNNVSRVCVTTQRN